MSNTVVNPDFDGIWKDALTRWLPDCIALFWPEVQAGVVSRDLAQRMLVYRFRLMEKHPRHNHFSCAILLDRSQGPEIETFRSVVGRSELMFSIPVINLAQWAARADELRCIAPANPFAVVILAQLACRATQASAESRLVSKLELAKLLKYWGYDVGQRINLLRIIDSLLILPKAMEDTFMTTLSTQIEEPQAMTFISNIERYYWQRHIDENKQGWLEEGLSKGEQLGQRHGAANVLQTLLQQKFGTLPDWATDQIHQADTSTLQRWAINVLSAQTLQAVFEL